MRERTNLEVQRERRQDPNIVIFRLSGKMIGTKECYEFLEDVRDEVHAGHRIIVLNLEGLTKVSSPGIGILAACYTSVTNARGRICIVAVPDPVASMLKIVCLWDLLPRYATEREALNNLAVVS